MNKCTLSICLLLSANLAISQPSADEIAAKRAQREAEEYRLNGGYVRRPNAGSAHIVFVNCQNRIADKVIQASAANLESILFIPFDCSCGTFDFDNLKIQGSASVFIVDRENYPPSLIAPEDKWAMVNVARLTKGADAAKLNRRLSKELSRSTALLCGAAASGFQNTITRCVTDVDQLDEIPDWHLPFDTIQKISTYVKGFGIKPYERATYLDACNEGWAPPPADDIQKSIWDKVHATPATPMKIEFDPKKGR